MVQLVATCIVWSALENFEGGHTKQKEAAISSTKAALLDGGTAPEGTNIPNAPETQ